MNRREFIKTGALIGAAASAAGTTLASKSAEDRITVGVLGSGARAQEVMEAALAVPGVEVLGVCDAYTGRAERAKARTGGKALIYDDYRRILDNQDIKTVIIGSPDHWHRQMALDSLSAGKDVYIEKPMTYAIEEGIEIIEAVKRSGRVLQVGSQGISSATQRMARKMVQDGLLGQVTMIRASYNRNTASGAWLYPIPPDAGPATIDWAKFLGPAPKRPLDLARFFRWRCYSDYSGGIATDLFVHLVTSIHYIMDAKMPRSVTATGELLRWKESRDVPDTVNGILVYPEGFTVNLSSTFNNQSSAESGFEILGTKGSIIFRGGRLVFKLENVVENNRWVVEAWAREQQEAYYNDPKIQAVETPSTWKPEMKMADQSWEEWGVEDTRTHVASFFNSVRTRQEPIENALIGHRAAACAHMVNLSLKRMETVYWDFDRERLRA